ncbi:oxalate:formate antiporter [Caballeronia sp. LZ062]|nr:MULTISPECIES: oxalate:formate antiporter [unclassified Caballeronia]MDR5856465.1 oxalate:formate antiporter [Caballeronia sp. LZ050]MDR5873135.1 oxalate:formate antiporter [Caballeronia sp. LZ062]
MNDRYEGGASNKALLLIFWLYVLIPLAWGITNTLTQAVKLFR